MRILEPKSVAYFLIALTAVFTSCNSSYGKKLIFNSGELYYTKNITEDEANKLGNFLVDDGFFNGTVISVQIDKKNDTYLFRMVSKEGVENDSSFIMRAQAYSNILSKNVFNGSKVDFEFCDQYLKTKKTIPFNPAAQPEMNSINMPKDTGIIKNDSIHI